MKNYKALRFIPKLFGMLWKLSPKMLFANILIRLLRSVIPLLLLYVGRLIVDKVMLLHEGKIAEREVWMLVLTELFLTILFLGSNNLLSLIENLLGELFTNHTSILIVEHAAKLDLDQLENAVYYDKLEQSRQHTAGRTQLLADVLGQLQDMISIFFLGIAIVSFNFYLAFLFVFAVIPTFVAESRYFSKSYELYKKQTAARREMNYYRDLGTINLYAKEIKAFGLVSYLMGEMKAISSRFHQEAKKLALRYLSTGMLLSCMGSISFYGAYTYTIAEAIKGTISIGELVFMVGSFKQVNSLLDAILRRFNNITRGAVYLKDFFDFFQIKSTILLVEETKKFPDEIKEGFVFKDVSFKYPETDIYAVKDISFKIGPKDKVLLVGYNGAGKTTIIKLLCRLYFPTEGKILLDGIDIWEYNAEEYKQHISVLFQDYLRYQMPFYMNVKIANFSEKNNTCLFDESMRFSKADSVLMELPLKERQMLGNWFTDGVELSGGQWQKVALARSYFRNTKMLILDEPSAALDPKSEYEIFQNIFNLKDDKMLLIVSHRFTFTKFSSGILMLEKGKIVEKGTHQELLNANGKYAELYRMQVVGEVNNGQFSNY